MGFVLKTGEIVEVENVCEKPDEGFDVKGEDLLKYEGQIQASWHTHPGSDSNLSHGDYASFLDYPEWDHYIVGSDGVACYTVTENKVFIA